MAKRKKEKRTYKYSCNLTGQEYILTQKANNPDDLMSVKAYYEMHQDEDDRPEDIKKKIEMKAQSVVSAMSLEEIDAN